jgi:soluble lytic murein transglycosylase-like protein
VELALAVRRAFQTLGVAIVATSAVSAEAKSAPVRTDSACAAHAAEAASRSRLPVEVLLRVMRAESAGDPRATSARGAMGCMQIMPATWRELTARYRLGANPYDARMNMIGGALYLAELARRFGFPAAYAAYNAGPGRYARHVTDGLPLPAETVTYARRVDSEYAGAPPVRAQGSALGRERARWQEADLFAGPRSTWPARSGGPNRIFQAVRPASEDDGVPTSNGLFPLTARDRAKPAGE